jgi:hypothetical protein
MSPPSQDLHRQVLTASTLAKALDEKSDMYHADIVAVQ